MTQKDAKTLTLTYKLVGVTGSSGGLHIHSGDSCQTKEGPGGHYWDQRTISSDPWSTTWTVDATGMVSGTFDVISGYTTDQVLSYTVVVHQGSEKVGCGVLIDVVKDPYNSGINKYRQHTTYKEIPREI